VSRQLLLLQQQRAIDVYTSQLQQVHAAADKWVQLRLRLRQLLNQHWR
jgi:hypothetical protein